MNPSTTLAHAVVDGLIAGGVRHVVLAPGSRSAPLAYALQAADRAGALTLHVRVDERAAGFLTLGLAKVSGVPAAIVTTSGTAVANLHPAVLEAHHGLVPMIVVSADRPTELRGIGANQTTTQPGIFGEAVRLEAELSVEDDSARTATTVADAVSRADGATPVADGGWPGPVHLNIALREPLVPDLVDPPRASFPAVEVGTSGMPGIRISASLGDPSRTLVIIGDLPGADQARGVVRALGECGWPVIAEPFGEQPLGPTMIPHGPLLLGTSWYARHQPDQLVAVGRVTLSRSVRAALTADPTRVTYLAAGPRWTGPSYPVARTVPLDEVEISVPQTPVSGWLESWRDAGSAVGRAIGPALTWGSGPALAAQVAGSVPDGSTIVIGSSNSVRDLELAADWSSRESVRVVANRGLAGIDGVVSTAVGVGLASGDPTYALVGDLTFLHDINALLIGPGEPRPDLTIIVANDDGGGIFSTLEPGEPERAADFERVFGTATGARIADLARAYGVRNARAGSPDHLADLVAERPSGIGIIEVPIDRGGHRDLRARLRDLAEAATTGL